MSATHPVGRLLLVAAIFGSAFAAIDVALDVFSSAGLAWVRMAAGALVLTPLVGLGRLRRAIAAVGSGRLAVLGALTFVVPYTLLGVAEQHLDPATVGVCFGASPAVSLLVSAVLERGVIVRVQTLLAVGLGALGAVLAVGGAPPLGDAPPWAWAAVAAVLVCYAASGALTRRWTPSRRDVPGVVAGALLIGACLGGVIMLGTGGLWASGPALHAAGWAAALYLGAVPTALGFLLRFALTVDTSVTWASAAGWLVPGFGALWAWGLFDTAVTASMQVGLVVVAAGLLVLSRSPGFALHRPAASSTS